MKNLKLFLNTLVFVGLIMGFSPLPACAADICSCDLNYDGRCDMRDWLLFGRNWGSTNCNVPGVTCACDLNSDGRCDMRDWLLFGKSWGRADCPVFSNVTLEGAWVTVSENDPTYDEKAYFLFDGNGLITDMGGFALDMENPGTYSVSPGGSVSMTTRWEGGGEVPLTGSLVSDADMTVECDNSQGQHVVFRLAKVSDRAACAGVWEGVLIEDNPANRYPIAFMVDQSGAVANFFEGFPADTAGGMYSFGSSTNSFFRTGAAGEYNQFSIVGGQISNNALSGYFVTDSGPAVDGTIELYRSGKWIDGVHYIEVDIDPHCSAGHYYMQCYIDDQDHCMASARLEGPYGQVQLVYNGSPSHPGCWSIPSPNENIEVPGTFPQKWTARVTYNNGTAEMFDQVIVGCDSE